MAEHRRVFLEQDPHAGEELLLPDAAAHHLIHVLRLRAGDPLLAISKSSGRSFESIVVSTGTASRIKIIAEAQIRQAPPPVALLVLSLLKGDSVDLAVEKATELGVGRIAIWKSERSIPTLKDSARKVERWNKIAQAAALQCRRTTIPEVSFQPGLNDAIAAARGHASYFCALSPDAIPMRTIERPSEPTALWIGPEGDFTPAEESRFRTERFIPLSLGTLTLRAETAAIAAVASAQALWGT